MNQSPQKREKMSSSWIQRHCGHDLAPFTKADVGGLQCNTSAVWTQYGTLSCALEFQLLCQLAGLKRACRTLVVENAALNCCPSCRVHSHVIIAYSTLKHHLATGPTTTAHADPAQSELALSSLGGYNSRKHFSFLKHCKKVGLQTPRNFDVQQALIHSFGPWTNSMLHFQTLPHLPRKPVYSLSEVM